MTVKQTEMAHAGAKGFDLLGAHEALTVLAVAQAKAAEAVQTAIAEIARAAELATQTLCNGGRLIYVAAGSSGLMALADALELPGTYGISPDQVLVLLAGGTSDMTRMPGGPEDDPDAARADVAAAAVGPGDCLIALTASGSTPYPMAAVEAARKAGAKAIGIANNADVPLFELVDVAICLPTPPEVIAGSTRMGAATAQKIALNMLSTLMAVRLGHVHDGYMVNLVADNIKLQMRAIRIVMQVSGASEVEATLALSKSGGGVKIAILLASGAESVSKAEQLLAINGDRVRGALAALKQ